MENVAMVLVIADTVTLFAAVGKMGLWEGFLCSWVRFLLVSVVGSVWNV